jgi:peptide/nickel transport system permease protein
MVRLLRRLAATATGVWLVVIFLVVLLVCALAGPFLVPYGPLVTDVSHALEAPSASHWFGTDQLGRDIFSRVIVATRLDLAIAVSAVLISFVLGNFIGAACGLFGGSLDQWVGRLVDVLMAFPLFVVAMAMVAVLGNNVENIIYATAVINLPFYIRLSRTEISVRREAAYVHAARLGGASNTEIVFGVLLPNIMPGLMVQMSINLGWAILNAAGLSFIGLGVRPPTPEWGILVSEGAEFIITGQWWVAAFPGLALILAVLGFNLVGDALRDLLDVRSRL